MDRCLFSVLCVALFVGIGCGQPKPAAVVEDSSSASKTATPSDAPRIVATTTPRKDMIVTAPDGTAEAAFQQTLIAFQDGRFDTVYQFLPPSYQADVTSLIKVFSEKMDPELWSTTFKTLTKIAAVLKSKKSFILSLDGIKRLPQIDSITPHWDSIASGIQDVSKSEIAELATLKSCDVNTLLASGSQMLIGLPLPKFGDVKVTTLKSDAETAVLSYRESNDSEPKQVEFVRVEGKWLPKSIASGWQAGVADAKTMLAELPHRISTVKPDAMMHLESLGGILDKMQAAKNSEEFNTAMAPLPITVVLGAQMIQQAIQDATSHSRKGKAVLCLINHELTDTELTELKIAILAALDNPSVDYEMIPNDGKTRCRFTPVPDVDLLVTAFKKHFSAATVRLDAETRTIHID